MGKSQVTDGQASSLSKICPDITQITGEQTAAEETMGKIDWSAAAKPEAPLKGSSQNLLCAWSMGQQSCSLNGASILSSSLMEVGHGEGET